jgi:hypothetical protein
MNFWIVSLNHHNISFIDRSKCLERCYWKYWYDCVASNPCSCSSCRSHIYCYYFLSTSETKTTFQKLLHFFFNLSYWNILNHT